MGDTDRVPVAYEEKALEFMGKIFQEINVKFDKLTDTLGEMKEEQARHNSWMENHDANTKTNNYSNRIHDIEIWRATGGGSNGSSQEMKDLEDKVDELRDWKLKFTGIVATLIFTLGFAMRMGWLQP